MPPPGRNETDVATISEFYAHILTPGFSQAFHAATLGRSLPSIAAWRAKALAAAQLDPAIMGMVKASVRAITAEDGLTMAQLRGPAQLPYWSRLAIRDYRKRGLSSRDLAAAFRCSLGTVKNVLQGKDLSWAPFSGERRLTGPQLSPPGKWAGRGAQYSLGHAA